MAPAPVPASVRFTH